MVSATWDPTCLSFCKHFKTFAYDQDNDRIQKVKQKIDLNKDIKIKSNKCFFDSNPKILKSCNVFIITVPTPVDKKNYPT